METPSRRIWVVKSGTNVLCRGGAQQIRHWMKQVQELRLKHGILVIWVFSGTVTHALESLRISRDRKSLTPDERQSLGAIGQSALISPFQLACEETGLPCAQVLVQNDDLADPERRTRLGAALLRITEWGGVPILNENDAVGGPSDLIKNNDWVAEKVARLVKAERLVFLSDVDGVFNSDPRANPRAQIIRSMDLAEVEALIQKNSRDGNAPTGSSRGSGGLATKLEAAASAMRAGIECWIASGVEPSVLLRVAENQSVGTRLIAGSSSSSRPALSSQPAPLDLPRLGRKASSVLSMSTIETRNRVLTTLALRIESGQEFILEANRADLAALPPQTAQAFRDRMTLSPGRISDMIAGLMESARLADPLGHETEIHTTPYDLKARKRKAPLGTIFMIFESRPNVAVEAFSAAIKSGNALLLRGGKECFRTLSILYSLFQEALDHADLPRDCFHGITDPDRSIVSALLKQNKWIDVVIPRGGDSLIEFVSRASTIPLIKNDRGMCHVYVHEDAAESLAIPVVVNAKTQRPGVCNAMETLLIHRSIAPRLLPELHQAMVAKQVHWYACPETLAILGGRDRVEAARPEHWDTEHLELKINCRVVDSLDEAVAHISEHGSKHSEAILTSSEKTAREFQARIDASTVYWNASTRFTDGFEFGLGSEIGISTQKLHVRGPVGIDDLTSWRWIVDGEGQTRQTK